MSKTHDLKILPQYFAAVLDGSKTFEVRYNDRGFAVGDFLNLREFDSGYTGRAIKVQVSYILDEPNYCKDGFVILGFRCSGGAVNE